MIDRSGHTCINSNGYTRSGCPGRETHSWSTRKLDTQWVHFFLQLSQKVMVKPNVF